MADEALLDENVRIPQENVLPRAKTFKPNYTPSNKPYIAEVYATLALVFGLVSLGSYAVSRNYVEPSHISPTPSLWWGAVYLFSIANLFFRPTTQRWRLGNLYTNPTPLEKWVFVILFSVCSGILLPSIFGYISSYPTMAYYLEHYLGINTTLPFVDITLPKVASDILGNPHGVGLFNRNLFSDITFLATAILIAFTFCALTSQSDFFFLMATLGVSGSCIIFWPDLANLLGLHSLAKFHPGTIQTGMTGVFLHLLIEGAYLIEQDLRAGRENVLLSSALVLADFFTVYLWRSFAKKIPAVTAAHVNAPKKVVREDPGVVNEAAENPAE